MNELIKITDHLIALFAIYKDEILVLSLTLNMCLLLILLMQATRNHGQTQQDKAKAAIYNPKPFRKN
ncbi:hypothetical protein ACO0LI_25215 [Undibacterium sp. Tian12W]